MNINQNINKLLKALSLKGKIYRINSYQFYIEKNDKYCTRYQILKRVLKEVFNIETNKIELQEKYDLEYDCYSKVDVMKYLMREYKGMS